MSVTKIIDEEDITLVQGVNGILLHKEGWIKRKKRLNTPSSLCINSCIFLPITIVSIFIVKKKEKRQEKHPLAKHKKSARGVFDNQGIVKQGKTPLFGV